MAMVQVPYVPWRSALAAAVPGLRLCRARGARRAVVEDVEAPEAPAAEAESGKGTGTVGQRGPKDTFSRNQLVLNFTLDDFVVAC